MHLARYKKRNQYQEVTFMGESGMRSLTVEVSRNTALQMLYTALHYTVMQCTALHHTALHSALHCTALHFTALYCTTLHLTVPYTAKVDHFFGSKPYLGGWRHQKTRTEYHNAATQVGHCKTSDCR